MRFIGDIHGEFAIYRRLVGDVTESVQIGDYGLGFGGDHLAPDLGPSHRFIRGNHDDPAVCAQQSNWIADGTVEQRGDETIMYVGGAWSIDRDFRLGIEYRGGRKCWWEDEELSPTELSRMIDIYMAAKPTIMVTHDCPIRVQHAFFPHYGNHYPTRTQQAFDAMVDLHKPDLWIFGHHHQSVRGDVDGIRFVCLDINEILDIDL